MPRGSPFTRLCQTAAQHARPVAADLHAHTTASDGTYCPSQVIAFAHRAQLLAIAITDHDTCAAIPEAEAYANTLVNREVQIVPGVELTCEFHGKEVHILGLFIQPNHAELTAEMMRLCTRRTERFHAYVAALAATGIVLDKGIVESLASRTASLGRRHVALLLERAGHARSRSDAWRRFIAPSSSQVPPKLLVPYERGIHLIHTAGGMASLAHPPEHFGTNEFSELHAAGLDAIEGKFPAAKVNRRQELSRTASTIGLRITGGSDCHGDDDERRAIGAHGLSFEEWKELRKS